MYINMDPKYLKKGGRKGTFLSKEDFRKKLAEFSYNEPAQFTDDESANEEIIENLMFDLFIDGSAKFLNSAIVKDISKIQFDTENVLTIHKNGPPNQLFGFQNIDDKFSFIGVLAGGDWEDPLFFIIYFDGQKLRGYVPTYGNTFNADYKTAFNSEGGQ